MSGWKMRGAVGFCAAILIHVAGSHAAVITSAHIFPVPSSTIGSGNGTLDFILLTESSGGSTNSQGSFNADNANTDMPTGSGKTTADESFITSFGELRDFYETNFPNGSGGSTVNQIVVMVDVNETGGPQSINLNTFDIWLNASVTPVGETRNNPAGNDISSSDQNKTNATFSGGTLLASLDSGKVLAQAAVGAGHPDRAIFTGINPFSPSFSDSDRFLIHWASSDHDNGGETIFLSGDFAPQDIPGAPEPGAMLLIGISALGLLARRAR